MRFWKSRQPDLERSGSPLSLDEYMSYFTYDGNTYSLLGAQTQPGRKQEEIGGGYLGLARGAFKANPVVLGCMLARMFLFSEARFQFRRLSSGRPGDYFGNTDLEPLEKPWPGGTTGDLLARAIQDVDLAGNFFCVRQPGNRLHRLRPDWVTIVAGHPTDEDADIWDPDTELIGYAYTPGGPGSGRDPIPYRRELVAHFAPIPDPEARFLGVSWLMALIREVTADQALTDHKIEFLENGGTPNMVVTPPPDVRDPKKFKEWADLVKQTHDGRGNRYKKLFLGTGANVQVVGANFEQIAFKAVQGIGETRIALAARVPAVIAGISEGLQGSSLNQGNYQMARRQMVDLTMNPLWRNFAGSMSVLVPPPERAELAHDPRDIPALREDGKDAAEILAIHAQAIRGLVDAGYTPESAIAAIEAGDLKLLVHTGLFSVQLQPPGSVQPSASQNGEVDEQAALAAATSAE
jgi:Phage portal protein